MADQQKPTERTKKGKNVSTTSVTSNGRTFRGTVVSAKMQDTATVAVERYVQHPKYKKFIRRTKKYLVHNPGDTAREGDVVTIREVKPISKRKHFAMVDTGADTHTDADADNRADTKTV